MSFTDQEILETVRMIELETLDIRTTTLGISLLDCADPDVESACEKIYTKIVHHARDLVATANSISADDVERERLVAEFNRYAVLPDHRLRLRVQIPKRCSDQLGRQQLTTGQLSVVDGEDHHLVDIA